MKKLLLSALAIAVTGMVNAQTWSEDFSSVTPTALPSGWSQNNVDGLTTATNVAAWNFGNNAWVSWNFAADPSHGNIVVSTSWYTPAGTSNDWLITPQFNVPANSVLEWQATAYQGGFQDGYLVKISTTGTATTDFTTTLLTVAAENVGWTTRGINLSAYAGQPVYIAFINNSNDKNRLYMDNFKVFVPPSEDGAVVSITGLNRYQATTSQNIAGSFKTFGYNNVTNAVLNYKINGNSVVTQTMNFATPLTYGQSGNYSFTTPGTLALGANLVKVWVTAVNGVSETNFVNDTAYAVVYVASKSVTRKLLIEEWSSSTCAPCANLNVNFDPLLNNSPNDANTDASDVAVIKYQVNWPSPGNDPSYNNHGKARVDHYEIDAAPTTIMNGRIEMTAHSQAEINTNKALPAFADITPTIKVTGPKAPLVAGVSTIVATATITPWVTVSGPVRVHQAILQSNYHYTTNTTTQKDFFHVMRKMDGNGWGVPKNLTDGTTFTVGFTYTATNSPVDPTPAQFSFNSWTTPTLTPRDIEYEYVVFLQDTLSNHVLQTASKTISVTPLTTGIKELNADYQISVYPNPAHDYANVGIHLTNSSSVDISIYDITGKLVYDKKGDKLAAGKHEINIETATLAPGVYNVNVKTDEDVLKEKLIISKQ